MKVAPKFADFNGDDAQARNYVISALSRFAISALRLAQLANLASCFQLLSHSADGGVAGFSLLTDLSVALIWVELQQFRDYPASFVRAQMTAMNVCVMPTTFLRSIC